MDATLPRKCAVRELILMYVDKESGALKEERKTIFFPYIPLS